MTSGRIVVLGLVVATAAAFTLVLTQTSSVDEDGKVRIGVKSADATCEPRPDEPCMPQLTYVDTDGTVWTPESLADKVVVINFWATWCAPCVAEIPLLADAYENHGGNLIVLGVMTDQVDDEGLAAFASRTGLSYPVIRADAEIMDAFGHPRGLPTTFVYDRSGHLQLQHLGPLNQRHMARIEPLLAD